jgi:diguanylate cyclase (GGDEF)-like protein/PAS domain S-box-containing protein
VIADELVQKGLAGLFEPGSLLEAMPECLVVATADGRIIAANRRMSELVGREDLAGEPLGSVLAAVPSAGIRRFETTCRSASGADVPVEVRVGEVHDAEQPLVLTIRDATELRHVREAGFEAEAKYRALVEQIPAVVYLDPVNENDPSIYVSPQVIQLLGVTPEDWLSDPQCWRSHVHPEDVETVWAEYQEAYRHHAPLNHEYRMVHEDGTIKWVMEQAFPVDDEQGNPFLIQGVIFDITNRKLAEEQVAYLAYHDKLTTLPNRARFEEMLDVSLARARRHELGVGVLYMDLDNFKLVNDSLGHAAGDELLIQLADRLRDCTRETDMVARQGGDEFMLLLSDLEQGPGIVTGTDAAMIVAETVADRVHQALRRPFDLAGQEFYASASIGVSLYPQDAPDAETLLRNADTAMYQSKRTAPGGSLLFKAPEGDPIDRLSFSTRLRRAVENRHWVLHYQPVLDIGMGTVRGVEALIRWQDPNGGIVPPGEFIPLAEEMGLIEAIGHWVIDELAQQDREWRQQGLELEISFNLSPRELFVPQLSERIVRQLSATGLPASRVVVEVTESAAMADPDRTTRILNELRAWGLTLAIDDFGTGYSSLARLKHMPVSILKIDQAFIRDVDRDVSLAGMVRAMIQLAQSLGMIPLAEGIETHGEYEFLRANGCRLAQGFLFSRPVPADQIPELVTREGGLIPRAASSLG